MLQKKIEELIQREKNGEPNVISDGRNAIEDCIEALDSGQLRVCEKKDDVYITKSWVKQAILYYFRLSSMEEYHVGPFTYWDKIPLKKNFRQLNVRVVPPAAARFGSFMESGVVLMPSYVNIGAYIGEQTMVDTWATVGSCAQIGKRVHLSGGVGIGGVLEPASATPVIVEDGAFVGSRCIIVEGVRIGTEAVLGANLTLTASTPIIDTRVQPFREYRGFVPPRCVVLSGTREKLINGVPIQLGCAYIVGERKESTDLKTSLNDALRDFSVSV